MRQGQLIITRHADYFFLAQHRPRSGHTAIIKAQMHALGIHLHRQSRIVIDNQRHGKFPRKFMQGHRLFQLQS